MSRQFTVVSLSLTEANEMVAKHHRHHQPLAIQLFSLGLEDIQAQKLVGAAIMARPVARALDDTETVEIARLVTDGTPNACSALMGAVAKAVWALGYSRLTTYIGEDEPGTSLKAAGWKKVSDTRPKSWAASDRDRTDKTPIKGRQRFQLLHPELLHPDQDIWWNRVTRMAKIAVSRGAARTSCPFSADHWLQAEVWREIFDYEAAEARRAEVLKA